MLDLKLIRDDPETVRRAVRAKRMPDALQKLDQAILLDEENRLLRSDLEAKQAERNASSKRIGELKRRNENADDLIRAMGTLSDEVKRLEEKSRSLEASLQSALLELPNIPHESVPYGESEHDNVTESIHCDLHHGRPEGLYYISRRAGLQACLSGRL